MRKRGMSHVEIIIAFILFIGFLIFGLYFFNPLKADRLLDSSLEYSERSVTSNISVELVSYSVIIDQNFGGSDIGIPLATFGNPTESIRVTDENGQVLNAGPIGGNLAITRNGQRFLKVLIGDIPPSTNGPATFTLLDSQYTISSSDTKKIVSEKETRDLKTTYDSSYLNLKKAFNLPGRVDFSFALVFSDQDTIVGEISIPENVDVRAHSSRVEVVRENGDISFADLRIRVW